MNSDAVLDEVREVRRRISARFEHDPARLAAYYMELQERFRDRLLDNQEVSLDQEPVASETGR